MHIAIKYSKHNYYSNPFSLNPEASSKYKERIHAVNTHKANVEKIGGSDVNFT